MNEINKKWLNLTEVSIISGESRATLLRRISSGELKGKQRANRGRWLFHVEDVKRYCDRDYNKEYKAYLKEMVDENK